MIKKIVILMLTLTVAGVAFSTLGGMRWIDSLGLRGQERMLKSRMVGYWEARLEGNTDKMSTYVHPSQALLVNAGMLVTEAYEIQGLHVDGDEAMATVKLRSRVKHALMSGTVRDVTLADKWVRYKGQWFKAPAPITMQDAIKNARGEWAPPSPETKSAKPSGLATESSQP